MSEHILKPERSKLSLWIQAARMFSYSASVMPVLIAAPLALLYHRNHIDWFLFPVIIICAVMFHAGSNLVSDYFDYKNSVDRKETFGSSRVIVEGLLPAKSILNVGLLMFAIGFALGMILVMYRGLDILFLGCIGLIGGLFYTLNPFRFKYIALGDLDVFVMFGPLLVAGAFFGLTGHFNWDIVWISIPIAFLVVDILHANNTRDIKHDSLANIKTLASLEGINGAKFEYYFLIIGAYVAVILLIIFKVLNYWPLLVFLSLPIAIKNLKEMSKASVEKPEVIAMLDVKTAQNHMIFGLLYVIGILLMALL